MIAVNSITYYKTKNRIDRYIETLAHIVSVLKCAEKIAGSGIEGIKEYDHILKDRMKNLKKITSKFIFSFFYHTQDPLTEYFKVFFLGEIIAFKSLYNSVIKYRDDIKTMYKIIGLLDSMISTASYRKTLAYYCIPSFHNEVAIDFTDMNHPLIKDPVPNSLDTARSILLTGSNASGKSTF